MRQRTDTSPGWINRRLRNIETQLRELRAARTLEQAAIGKGGIRLVNGGGLTVDDGGDIIVNDEGYIRWFGAKGNERFTIGRVVGNESGADDIRLAYNDAQGISRVLVGTILNAGTGQPRGHGILVEGSGGTNDLLAAHEEHVRLGRNNGTVILHAGDEEQDELDLRDPDNNLRATLGPVKWEGASEGYGLYIARQDGSDICFISRERLSWRHAGNPGLYLTGTTFSWSASGRETMYVDEMGSTGSTGYYGGQTSTGSGVRCLLQMVGDKDGTGTVREMRARDGANSTYIPIAASDFPVRTSSAATKTVLGDVDDPLGKVCATPIKRWRHKTGPSDSNPGAYADEAPERIGPMAEEVPTELADQADPEGGVSLPAAVWMLWGAVQQQQAQIDQLRAEVDELRQPPSQNGGDAGSGLR